MMRFWKPFSKEIKDWDIDILGYMVPRGYGYGYRDFNRAVTHYYLFPFNYAVQVWRWILYRVVYGARPLKWEQQIYLRVRKGFEAGYDKGYEAGLHSGRLVGQEQALRAIDQQLDKRRQEGGQ